MTDTEMVDWIAEHLTHLRVYTSVLEYEYLDDDGKSQWSKYISTSQESIPQMLRSALNSKP